MGFWDSLQPQHSGNFNIQDFIKFYNDNKNKDMNQALQQLIQSGQVTQEQVNNAMGQAKDMLAILKRMGIFK